MPVEQTSGQVFRGLEYPLIAGTYGDGWLLCDCGIPVMDATGVADGCYGCIKGGYHRGRIVHDLVVSDWLRERDRYPNSHDLRAVPALDRRRALCAGWCECGVAGGRVHRAAVRLRAA